MELLKNRIIFLPVLFLFFLFTADKVFLLPEVRNSFIQPGGMTYYVQREQQKSEIKNFLASEKSKGVTTAVVFGDSRSFAIGDVVVRRVMGRSDWKVYNFAGPQAMPVYHAYLAEEIFSGKRRPEVLILSLSLDSFNRNSGLMHHPNLNWGVSGEFVERHATMIPRRDLDQYHTSRRYALPGLQFSLKYLLGRISSSLSGKNKSGISPQMLAMAGFMQKDADPAEMRVLIDTLSGVDREDLSVYSSRSSPHVKVLDLLDGAQYSWFGRIDERQLKEDTERISSIYLKHFRVSEEQFFFLRKTLKNVRNAGARTIIVLPLVNPYLQEIYLKNKQIQELKDRIYREGKRYGAKVYDLNADPKASCDHFYDASHLSIVCFPGITRRIIQRLESPSLN